MGMLDKKLKSITVDRKTGFRNITGNPIVLLDERGIPFYNTQVLDKKVWQFNLPPGTYYIVSGRFTEMPEPVNYPLSVVPPPMRYKKGNPENFELVFSDNPFTGTIAWKERMIVLDNELKDMPLPTLVFILNHEYGHRYYGTRNKRLKQFAEKCCDLYARNQMINEGYNPSQIGESIAETLDDNNLSRIANIINHCVDNTDTYSPASDYIGSLLLARKKVDVYDHPGGNILYSVNAGQNVGTIESWVMNANDVWWMLVNKRFVKHSSTSFDADVAKKTSYPEKQKELKAEQDRINRLNNPFQFAEDLAGGVTDVVSGAGKALSSIGDNFGTLLLVVGGLAVAIYFSKSS